MENVQLRCYTTIKIINVTDFVPIYQYLYNDIFIYENRLSW